MITLEEDKLKREQLIKDLFNIFKNFGNQNDRGLTMIINGKYGSGKSTLLNFLKEENAKNEDFNIIKYNAWENNLFDNPLIPILHTISNLKEPSHKIKESAKNILKSIPKILLSTLANAHSIDLQSLITNENIFDDYDKYKENISKFKNILKDYCLTKTSILLVDELDRCLPEYQIKVLECIYHLLDIPNLIVVIALDKEQLECAVKNMFGEQQNTIGYLTKFIQYEIDLPSAETYEYIKQIMKFSSEYDFDVKCIIAEMFKIAELPIRESMLIINELNLMLVNNKNGYGNIVPLLYWHPMLIAFLLILKRTNQKVFKEFFGELNKSQENYPTQTIELKDSIFNKFLTEIQGTSIDLIIEFLLKENFGQCFMVHLINAFLPIRKINIESLSNYINSSIDRVNGIIDGHSSGMKYYPDFINNIIEKLKILK